MPSAGSASRRSRSPSTSRFLDSPRPVAPRCIGRRTRVEIGPLIGVDGAFGWDEGKGDRTRVSWLENHRPCFARQATRERFLMHDDIETALERFEIVWPPEHADRRPA
jgi:uncharacterized protein YhfF